LGKGDGIERAVEVRVGKKVFVRQEVGEPIEEFDQERAGHAADNRGIGEEGHGICDF